MTIPYKDILLWGHSLQDYIDMFALTESDLATTIIDAGAGPASFNAELTKKGGTVISTDEIFELSEDELKTRVDDLFAEMLEKVKANKERFVWEQVKNPDELANTRKKELQKFFADFSQGKSAGRYQEHELPNLPFSHFQFDLALCSHYLFANSQNQSVAYHVAAIENLADIAKEVRIFPLLNSYGDIPEIVGPVMHELHNKEFGVEIKAVDYEFQKKGNAMLRVWAQTCEV